MTMPRRSLANVKDLKAIKYTQHLSHDLKSCMSKVDLQLKMSSENDQDETAHATSIRRATPPIIHFVGGAFVFSPATKTNVGPLSCVLYTGHP
jgi:hypothetical protein